MSLPLRADEKNERNQPEVLPTNVPGGESAGKPGETKGEGGVVIPLKPTARPAPNSPSPKSIPVVRIPPRPKKAAVPDPIPRPKRLLPEDRTVPSAFPTRPKLAVYDPKWDSAPPASSGAAAAPTTAPAAPGKKKIAPPVNGSSLALQAGGRVAGTAPVKPVIRRKYVRAEAPKLPSRPIQAMPRKRQKALLLLHVGPWVAFLVVALNLLPAAWQFARWPDWLQNGAAVAFGLYVLGDTIFALRQAFRSGRPI